jgi:signal transduction histidine kinase
VPTRLGGLLEKPLEQARAKMESLHITVDVDPRLHDVEVCCDSSQMARAIGNLVFNAIDAIGEGGNIWIRLAGLRDDAVSVAVDDNGPGIDPSILHRIFNPFFTTKDCGTGLGLSIVHGIIEAHGGRVSAGQRTGGGASFVLTLPRDRASECTTVDSGIRSIDSQEVPTAPQRRNPLFTKRQGGENTHGSYRRS